MKSLSSLLGRKSAKMANGDAETPPQSPTPSSPRTPQSAVSTPTNSPVLSSTPPVDKRKTFGSLFGRRGSDSPALKAPESSTVIKYGTLTKEGEKVKVCITKLKYV